MVKEPKIMNALLAKMSSLEQKRKDRLLNQENDEGYAPLALAVRENKYKSVNLILNGGADVNIASTYNLYLVRIALLYRFPRMAGMLLMKQNYHQPQADNNIDVQLLQSITYTDKIETLAFLLDIISSSSTTLNNLMVNSVESLGMFVKMFTGYDRTHNRNSTNSLDKDYRQALLDTINQYLKIIHLLLVRGVNFPSDDNEMLNRVMPWIKKSLELNPLEPDSLKTVCLRKIKHSIERCDDFDKLPLPKYIRSLLKGPINESDFDE